MIRLKALFIALLSLPAAAHALSASQCVGTSPFSNDALSGTFACGEFTTGGFINRAGFPPTSPAINAFIPGSNNQGTASVDSRNLMQFGNGAYFAAQAHSVSGSNFVELQAQAGRLSGASGLNSQVMAGTSWQDGFRLHGGTGETELAITVSWPGLTPPPPGYHGSVFTMNDPAFLTPSWEGNFQLRYREGTPDALNQPFLTGGATHDGSFHTMLNEYQGSATYRFTVPYDTWIALEGSLLVSAVNTNKSFAGGVSITGMDLPNGALLETYSGHQLYALASAPVPEPETWATLLAGLGVVTAAARRKRAGSAATQA